MTTTASAPVDSKYEMVVGLEVHVQLRTRTKLFCNCSTHFGEPPNRNTCPICLALPGSLPVLNETAVELATRAALALGATVQTESIFARKNYFYPDLPKGYQISQFDKPLATDGVLTIGEKPNGAAIRIGITRVHMEEDAGKSIHDRFAGVSAIDLNRAGVPLIEIVSEPDLRSSVEAGSYLRLLKQLLEYVDVSDLNMEEGSLRVDANISIRPRGATKLGTKTEVKNMNSFSGVERALDAEFARQVAIVEAHGSVEQQTLLWDADRGTVRPARTKEGSHDYRYFPDPDLPPLRRHRRHRLQGLPLHEALGVVLQVLPHSRGVDDDLDADLAQVLGRPDAREHQQLRPVDGPRREDHLAAGGHVDRVPGVRGAQARAGGPGTRAGRVEVQLLGPVAEAARPRCARHLHHRAQAIVLHVARRVTARWRTAERRARAGQLLPAQPEPRR